MCDSFGLRPAVADQRKWSLPQARAIAARASQNAGQHSRGAAASCCPFPDSD